MTSNEISKTSEMSAPEQYWNKAGELGYADAMYSSSLVGKHVIVRTRSHLLNAAHKLSLDKNSNILELGCGDGEMANNFLSEHFKSVEAHDLAPAGIERANKYRKPNAKFFCTDITQLSFTPGTHYDAVFLIGILHHVKAQTPSIIQKIAQVTNKVIVMEPNGNHLARKFLELLPSYRRAGEDSFRKKQIEKIFSESGFQEAYFQRYNIFPNFTANSLYPFLKRLELVIEGSKYLDFLCNSQILAFEKATKKR